MRTSAKTLNHDRALLVQELFATTLSYPYGVFRAFLPRRHLQRYSPRNQPINANETHIASLLLQPAPIVPRGVPIAPTCAPDDLVDRAPLLRPCLPIGSLSLARVTRSNDFTSLLADTASREPCKSFSHPEDQLIGKSRSLHGTLTKI